jgi:hypothetical protein
MPSQKQFFKCEHRLATAQPARLPHINDFRAIEQENSDRTGFSQLLRDDKDDSRTVQYAGLTAVILFFGTSAMKLIMIDRNDG